MERSADGILERSGERFGHEWILLGETSPRVCHCARSRSRWGPIKMRLVRRAGRLYCSTRHDRHATRSRLDHSVPRSHPLEGSDARPIHRRRAEPDREAPKRGARADGAPLPRHLRDRDEPSRDPDPLRHREPARGWAAERAFHPWGDMADEIRKAGVPLWSLETRTPFATSTSLGSPSSTSSPIPTFSAASI